MRKKYVKDDCFFSMTWDYLNVFLPSQHQSSPKTADSYADALTVFRRYVTDVHKIPMEKFCFKDMTYDFMLDYRIFLEEAEYAPATINHRLAVVSAYMRYAAMRRPDILQIYLNIKDVPYVTAPSKILDIIEDENALAQFLSAPPPSKIGVRDQTILTILFDTAIRCGELIHLNLGDVNIECSEPYIFVHGKGDKERIIYMSPETVPILQQFIDLYHSSQPCSNTPFIYTVIRGELGRISERSVERIVTKYADIVRKTCPNIPDKVTPHTLRRTRVTGLYRDGVDLNALSKMVGHSSIETTRKSYAKPSAEMMRKGMEKSQMSNIVKEPPLWKDDEELARLYGLR